MMAVSKFVDLHVQIVIDELIKYYQFLCVTGFGFGYTLETPALV